MRTAQLLSVAFLYLLAACAPAAPLADATAASPSAASRQPSEAPQPRSEQAGAGGRPLLALVRQTDSGYVIEITELETERVLATLPVAYSGDGVYDILHFSPDGTKLAYNPTNAPTQIYDLQTGQIQEIPFSDWVADQQVEEVAWSPSQRWLSVASWGDHGGATWIYDLESGEFSQAADTGASHWAAAADVLLFRDGAGEYSAYDPLSGRATRLPLVSDPAGVLAPHGYEFDIFDCVVCHYPELGNVQELKAYRHNGDLIDYQLIDLDSNTELAFIARFQAGPGAVPNEYNANVVQLFAMPTTGDYLLFVQEVVGSYPAEQERLYTTWSTGADLPIQLSLKDESNKLFNVLPLALSPDERSFIGLRFQGEWEYYFSSVVVVDLQNGAVLYEYDLGENAASFWPGSLHGVALAWPAP